MPSPSQRVVHVSTGDTVGGAARAAFRLHRALRDAGADSTMLVRDRYSREDDRIVALAPAAPHFTDFYGSLVRAWSVERNRTAVSNSHFSLAWPGLDLSAHPVIQGADVVHLHWAWDFQSTATLGRLMGLGKPVVWTFHDQRALTGGCHYSAGCRGYEAACAECPQLASDPFRLPAASLSDQEHLWAVDDVTVAAPSRWMADCARRSRLWRRSRIEVVPNSVDLDAYRPRGRDECRRALGIPSDAVCILFGSDQSGERRKGLGTLMEALARCAQDPAFADGVEARRIWLASLGRPLGDRESPVPVQSLGHRFDDDEMATAYAAADVFVLPSLEDNLPNMALESLSCGTPVLAFDVGGVPDLVVEGRTGWLARAGDTRHLAEILLRLATQASPRSALAARCRAHVLAGFSPATQARRTLDLYDGLRSTSASPAGPVLARAACGPRFRQVLPQVLASQLARVPFEHPSPPAVGSEAWQLRRRRLFVARLVPVLEQASLGRLEWPAALELMERALEIPLREPRWHERLLLRGRRVLGIARDRLVALHPARPGTRTAAGRDA